MLIKTGEKNGNRKNRKRKNRHIVLESFRYVYRNNGNNLHTNNCRRSTFRGYVVIMVIINKRKKEMEMFVQMLALTNFSMLVKKGICTPDEWNNTSEICVKALLDVQERKGDFNDVIAELQNKEL